MNQIKTNIYRRFHRNGKEAWMVRWKDPNTNLWVAKTAGQSKNEALLIEAKIRQDLAIGKNPASNNKQTQNTLTVVKVAELFLKSIKFLNADPYWQSETVRRLNKDIIPKLGELNFKTLKQEVVLKFYWYLKNERVLSHASIQKYHSLLSSLGDIYSDYEENSDNPIRTIRKFKRYFPNQAPGRAINFLTQEELKSIYEIAKSEKYKLLYPYIKFLGSTGLRCSEANALEWSDIDYNSGFICIRDSKNKKPRIVPLEAASIEAVGAVKRKHKLIFARETGLPMSSNYVLRLFQRIVKSAGIEKRVDLHSLRHSYGSNKLREGWGLKKVSTLLGHSDIKVTAKVYTHLLDGDLKIRDEFVFDNKQNLANDSSLKDSEMSTLLSKVIIELTKISDESLSTNLKTTISQIAPILTNQAPTTTNNKSTQVSTTTPKTAFLATPVLRKLNQTEFEGAFLFPTKYELTNDFKQITHGINIRPHGDSNPSYRREKAMS